jgi:hypothetical protein
MPRGRRSFRFSLGELMSLMRRQTSHLTKLKKERTKLVNRLREIDREIASVGGGNGGGYGGRGAIGGGGRARNAKSLVATLEDVLGKNGKPMKVGEIVQAVEAAGYRSGSANFRAIVNQTLIKERKRFQQADRGTYALKK